MADEEQQFPAHCTVATADQLRAEFDAITQETAEYEATKAACRDHLKQLGITEDELVKQPEGTMAKLEASIDTAREAYKAQLAELLQVGDAKDEGN